MADSITWARPSASVPFCAVAHIADGTVLTYCKGRWSTSDTVELYDGPALDRRCKRCGGCLVALGLAELRDATAIDKRPVATSAFDLSDAEIDQGLNYRGEGG